MATNTNDLSDSQIVSLVLKGDKEMYATLVERYEAKLLRYAMYLLKDHDIASDAVQDTFIKAYINLFSFHLNKSFSSWIYRILHNEAMNLIKRNKRTSTFTEMDMDGDEVFVKFSTDKIMDKNLLKASVRKCMSNIDIKYQEVLALYFFDNLKYDEISDILHVPSSTVGVRIKRAKESLMRACKNDGVNYEQ
ncbi:MAG: RNA polymerase sigma factor [Prolixibacteraceae bacterium]|nr:RNA polymerase sigma factor [Prolixibacteraceae bacterium]